VPRTRSGKTQRRYFRGVLEGVTDVPEGVESTAWQIVLKRAQEAGLLASGKPKL
jgi:hypothetical protein